ncbi:hypothetical protein OAU20_02700 [Nitrosopumilus sp.]|nr:hypothetical protein [Nitrosopumilus sp.]
MNEDLRPGTCKRICLEYTAKKPSNMGRYDAGQKRCQICEIFITDEGTVDEQGLWCKCCNYRVRGKPRNRIYKEKLRNNLQNNSNLKKQEDGKIETSENDIEQIESTTFTMKKESLENKINEKNTLNEQEDFEFNQLLDALNEATDSIDRQLDQKKFLELIAKLNEKHPLMYLPDLLKDYIRGETLATMIDKHHLIEYGKINYIFESYLKFKLSNRKSLHAGLATEEKQNQIEKENLKNEQISSRYHELRTLCGDNIELINSNLIYNLIRAYTILLFFIKSSTIIHDEISKDLPEIIEKYSHLVRSKPKFNPILKNFINEKIINETINELILQEHIFSDAENPKKYTISPKYLKIPSLVKNIITENNNGISHSRLFREIHNKRTLFDLIPNTGIVINSILELEEQKIIIRKRGLNTREDQYFIPSEYEKQNLQLQKSIIQQGRQKFFGRRITPDDFISELHQLGRGDFEPEDDQVTRIAGMVLSSSTMLKARGHTPPLFDLTVDMTNYQFTPQQIQVLQETKIELLSNIVHMSIMINEKLDFNEVKDMIREIPQNEQGLIICFKDIDDDDLNKLLQETKTIQIVNESNFKKWCQITPVIPCRLGAIANIRYGDHTGQLAQINSINYESGLAEIMVFPSLIETTQYIGSLEEITFTKVNQFREISNKYYYFLKLLFDTSYGDEFKKGILNSEDFDNVKINMDLQSISCTFSNHVALIDASGALGTCNCSIFEKNFQTNYQGLCSHLIYAYNIWFKKLIDSDEIKISNRIQHTLYLLQQKINSPLLKENKVCPNCGLKVKTIQEQNDLFGTRIISGKVVPQSWCRECRSSYNNNSN